MSPADIPPDVFHTCICRELGKHSFAAPDGRVCFHCPATEKADRLFAMAAFKRLHQPLHFDAGAKQCEQASNENHAAPGHQEEIDARIQLGKMPEHGDSEQGAATEKQKYVLKESGRE
jgi:hypothetical protein